MNKKIVYFLFQPLSQFNHERLGIDTLTARGWDVECWIYLEKFNSNFENKEKNYITGKNVYIIKSFFDCLKELRRLSPNFYFVDSSSGSFLANIIQRIMIIKGGKRISFQRSLFPYVENTSLKFFLINRNLKSFIFFINKFIKIIYTLFNNKFIRPKANYIFTAGNIPYANAKNKNNKTKVISAHSYDYDTYLNLKNLPVNQKYLNSIVYIDQAYESNYEIKMNKLNLPTNEKFHWDSLNLFFDNLSKKLKKKIFIAPHHRRDKNDNINTHHEIIYSKIGNLIKDCSLVVAHDSVAISFAILFKKPIIFLTSNEITKSVFDISIKKFASELGVEPININQFQSFDDYDFLYFNQNAYQKWTDDYIKSPNSKTKSFWLDFDNYFEIK